MDAQQLLVSQIPPLAKGQRVSVGRAYGCVPALLLAELAEQTHAHLLVIAPTVAEAENLETELQFFRSTAAPYLFPDPETLPYDTFSPHQDLVSRRLQMLSNLLGAAAGITIVAAPTLFYRLPPLSYIRANSLSLHEGQHIGISPRVIAPSCIRSWGHVTLRGRRTG